MFGWFRREKKAPGWLAISLGTEFVDFVHAQYASGGKSSVSTFGSRRIEPPEDAERIGKSLRVERYDCTTLLAPGEYQLLLVEAPAVPPVELKSAMRWRIKDMIDYHADDATLDLLEIPSGNGGGRARMMYVVAAHNNVIQERIKRFESAGVPLSVVDIPELGQRNIAALYEDNGRGIMLLHFGDDAGLMTVSAGGELYLARRLDVGLRQLAAAADAERTEALQRVALEFHRTLDHLERQYRNLNVARLLLAPTPQDTGLADHLAASLGVPVEQVDLAKKLQFGDGGTPDATAQWRLFHHFGAALRHEATVL